MRRTVNLRRIARSQANAKQRPCSCPPPPQHHQLPWVEEGIYENGVFKFQRIWTGDETGWRLDFGTEPVVLRVSLATY